MVMSYFIDAAYDSLNKYGEELCGDKVEIVRMDNALIAVLSDGLGSGVKANILASLTSKIAATMLKKGSTIFETVDTIMSTLPVCSIRKLAYSTFTIVKVHDDGRVYIAEYDNPPFFIVGDSSNSSIYKNEIVINGKKVKESAFTLKENEKLVIVSDGVIHAGIGKSLNLGWQWEDVFLYLQANSYDKKCSSDIVKDLIGVCRELYCNIPGDDATVVSIMVRKPEVVNIFSGPPIDRSKDSYVINKLMSLEGKKIVCGGTAGNIAARELKKDIIVDIDYIDPNIPPTAKIKGIDLVTEGVLTLKRTVEKLSKYHLELNNDKCENILNGEDGASRLAKILIHECTHLNMIVGRAINPAHQNPSFPAELSIKLNIIDELVKILREMGKQVDIEYV